MNYWWGWQIMGWCWLFLAIMVFGVWVSEKGDKENKPKDSLTKSRENLIAQLRTEVNQLRAHLRALLKGE